MGKAANKYLRLLLGKANFEKNGKEETCSLHDRYRSAKKSPFFNPDPL